MWGFFLNPFFWASQGKNCPPAAGFLLDVFLNRTDIVNLQLLLAYGFEFIGISMTKTGPQGSLSRHKGPFLRH